MGLPGSARFRGSAVVAGVVVLACGVLARGEFVAAVVDRCSDRHLRLWRSVDGTTWAPVPVGGSSGVALEGLESTAVDDHVAVMGAVRHTGAPGVGLPGFGPTTVGCRSP